MRDAPPSIGSALHVFEAFRAAILPTNLSDAVQAQFAALARPRSAAAGGRILAEEIEDTLVFLAAGAAKLVAYASQGREQVVAFYFAGDLIPVPAPRAHSYILVALRECEALAFQTDEFLSFAGGDPALMRSMVRSTLASLHRSREKSIVLGRKTARERVASFLVSMAERMKTPDSDACALELPMSRRDIADSLGLTIETVSRQLSDLREEALIETCGRSGVRLLGLAALRHRAGHIAN